MANAGLHELETRTRRVTDMFGMLPGWRGIGPLTLDKYLRQLGWASEDA